MLSGLLLVSYASMTSVAKYADLRAETSSAFDKLGTFLADMCEGSEAHHDSSDRPNLDTNLGSFYETFTALKARHADQNLTVAVLALTKSGECLCTVCVSCLVSVSEVGLQLTASGHLAVAGLQHLHH